MKKTHHLLLSAILLVGCAANPASNVPTATVGTATPIDRVSTGTPVVAGEKYKITPDTSKIEWTGSKVTGKHDGGFKEFSGQINLVDNNPEKSSVSVDIKTASLYTDDPDLVDHLKSSDFFDAEKNPTCRFESTRIAKKDNGYEISGDLTMHGVTKGITFPATIETGDTVKVKSDFSINRFDFDMKYPGKADNLIRKEVVIRLDINAPKGEAPPLSSAPGTPTVVSTETPAATGTPEATATPDATATP